MEKTRKCPYCGEEIMADAKKCRHCGEWLGDEAEPKQEPVQETAIKESENQPRNEVLAATAAVKEPLADSVPNKPNESLFKSCFWEQITKHYCDFKGNVDRKTFWVCYLYYSLIMLVIAGVSTVAPLFGTILMTLVTLGLLLPSLGLMVRRLHDIGKKGAWILILLVPLVGAIWLLVLLAKKGLTQNPNKWNMKDTIITIAMVVVGIGLYVFGLSGITSNLADGIGRKGNRQEIGANDAENEIKAEIERRVLEAYNNGTISDLVTPEFSEIEKAADVPGYLPCLEWDYFYDVDFCFGCDPGDDVDPVKEQYDHTKVSGVKTEIIGENEANVYVTIDHEGELEPTTIILAMMRNGGQWLVDDVKTTGEFAASIKELMINCAKENEDVDNYVDDGSYEEEVEDESTLDLRNVSYEEYYNPRFDFSVSYPSFFKRKYEAANQDGCEFEFGNNYSMRVYGMNNVLEKTIKELFKDSKKSTDTYSTSKDNWFIVSGVNEQGNIYYRKTILEDEVEYVVELVYPQAKKTEYDAVVKKVISSFQVMGGEDEDGERYVVIDGSELRLRLGPSTSSETLKWGDGSNRHPEVGEVFRLLDETVDFYKIDYKGNEVWVSKQFSHIEIQ